MIRPSMKQIETRADSYYTFVVGIAKRARDLATKAEDEHEILEEKPVKLAVEEFVNTRYKIHEARPKKEETVEKEIQKDIYTGESDWIVQE